jgi:hypothetical protein
MGEFFPDNSSGMNNPHCLIEFHGLQDSGHGLMCFRMDPGCADSLQQQ